MTYTIPNPVQGELGIGNESVSFEYAAGEVTAADDREAAILAALAEQGLAVAGSKPAKSTIKPKAEAAPADAVITEG